ncbi:MAG: DUF3034 family protein [Silvibacterium sp.]|nr:DUF3034 family protein [Silvibacterium sp.]
MIRTHKRTLFWLGFTLALLQAFIFSIVSHAQNLGYEGPTGIFVTPIASVAPSEGKGFGHPVVAYHFLNGGDVIGNYSTVSVTEGAFKRIEFGYTAELQKQGDDHTNSVNLAPLWTESMHIVHGKANLLAENSFNKKWVPAISVGAIGRFNDNNVGDGTNSAALHEALSITNGIQTTKNADVYLVGTKVVTQFIPKVPVLLSGGVRGTNAVLWGLGGNSVDFEARGFGAAAFVLTGPAKSTIILAAEVAQQPHHLAVTLDDGRKVGIFNIPTSEVYAVRVLPFHKYKLNADFGVLQAAGHIGASPTLPDVPVNLNARARFAMGLSYGF